MSARGEPAKTIRTVDDPGRSGSEAVWPHHALLALFVFAWGGNFVLAEVALREMAPISFSVARFAIASAALVALLCLQHAFLTSPAAETRRLFPAVRSADWPRLLLVAVVGAALAPWLGIEGLGLTHGARASLWLALGPVLSSGFGHLFRTERIGTVGYAGIILSAFGTFALALDGLDPARSYWLGDLLLLLALLLSVAELHLIKPLALRYGPMPMVTARTVLGGLLFLGLALPALTGESWSTLTGWTWIAILAGGAVGVGLGQWIKVRALRALGPTRVVLYGNLVPLAALWLAWTTLGTVPSPLEITAGVLIVIGALCLQVFDPAASRPAAPGGAEPLDALGLVAAEKTGDVRPD